MDRRRRARPRAAVRGVRRLDRRLSEPGSADSIDEVAASGFAAGAAAYEQARPGYPEDLVAWLVERCGIGPGRDVVDLAAGTGKLTRLLVPTGARVVAVEPVDAMRDRLEVACPGVDARAGTAEAIGLPDGSADVVTVAQAFHWFDPPAALAEIARVLRPGGWLAIAYNERDDRVPWVAELNALFGWDHREDEGVPRTVEVDWAPVLAAHGPGFDPAERFDTVLHQPMDPDLLVARVLSTSYVATWSPERQAELSARVRDLVAPFGAGFDLPYVSVAYAARRR